MYSPEMNIIENVEVKIGKNKIVINNVEYEVVNMTFSFDNEK